MCHSSSEEETVHETGTTGNAVSAGDRDFVDDLTIAGMAEVELGRMAMERSDNPWVKQFGDMMVRDHSKAGEELKQIAMKYAIPTPAGLDQPHQDLKTKLSNLKGVEFDREYMNAMVEGHEDVVDRLQTRASEDRFGDDKGTVTPERSDNPVEASINQWAANALPTCAIIWTRRGTSREPRQNTDAAVAGGLPPSREASADHRSLGEGGQASGT